MKPSRCPMPRDLALSMTAWMSCRLMVLGSEEARGNHTDLGEKRSH
jgi:hypothetical protein